MRSLVKTKDNYLIFVVWLLAAVLFSLLLAKIFISNQLATGGSLSSSKSLQLKTLRQENQQLQNQVSQLGSVRVLAQRADKLGLNRISRIETLPSASPVAYNP